MTPSNLIDADVLLLEEAELVEAIATAHRAAGIAFRTSLERARDCGNLLIEAKRRCRHGTWLPWLKANVEFSVSTAANYMRIAQRWDEITNLQPVANFKDALKLLASAPDDEPPNLPAGRPDMENTDFSDWECWSDTPSLAASEARGPVRPRDWRVTAARKFPTLSAQVFEVRHSDFREVLSDVESAKLILTDPPYGRAGLPLWHDLGAWAAKALASDGLLIAYSGQFHLREVLNALSEHLTYWWCGAVIHRGDGHLTPMATPTRKVINRWKPLVMFYPQGGTGFDGVFPDLIDGAGPDKTHHNWGQPEAEARLLVERFTQPGDLVVDPFAGSGAFCKAAHDLGRRAVGAEVLTPVPGDAAVGLGNQGVDVVYTES